MNDPIAYAYDLALGLEWALAARAWIAHAPLVVLGFWPAQGGQRPAYFTWQPIWIGARP